MTDEAAAVGEKRVLTLSELRPTKKPQPSAETAVDPPSLVTTTVSIRACAPTSSAALAMPLVGLGTFRAKGPALVEAVRYAVAQCGVRLIDGAEGYKNAEFIAEGIAKSGVPRSDIFITSKVSKESMTPEKVKACVAAQAAAFGGYVDLMLIHWPGNGNANVSSKGHAAARVACWQALQEEASAPSPKVRSIGVSNFTVAHLEHLLSAPTTNIVPSVNQVELHPFLPQEELRRYCAEKGIVVQGYTTLGRSTEPPKCLYGNWEPDLPRLVRHDVVIAIAAEVKRSCEQVLLKWSLQKGVGVIPKAVSLEHVRQNAALGDFTLTDGMMQRLDALDAKGTIVYAYRPEKVPL